MQYLILFDIDGTLIRMKKGFASPIFFDVIKKVLNYEIDKNLHIDFAGRTDYGILTHIFNSIGLESSHFEKELEIIYDEIYLEFKSKLQPDSLFVLDGVKDLLSLISENDKISMGLVTGNFKKNAILKLEYCGLDHFFKFGAFGDIQPNRLDLPKIAFQNANSNNGNSFTRENTLVIGDTHRDIQSAEHNKMKSMGVATGGQIYSELLKFGPNLIFENLEDYRTVYNSILKLFKI
jgi:phosphoglycolate phosphatase-like HAD superfamily hydrolase